MEDEIWKDIDGYEGRYKVSNKGRVKSIKRKVKVEGHPQHKHTTIPEKISNGSIYSNGYREFSLFKNGVKDRRAIHRLVAQAFIPNPEDKPQINHKDSDPSNNCVNNLEWCTASENKRHNVKNGLNNPPRGKKQGNSRLTKEDVLQIRSLLSHDWFTQKEIAESYNVVPSHISDIKRRKRWAHI